MTDICAGDVSHSLALGDIFTSGSADGHEIVATGRARRLHAISTGAARRNRLDFFPEVEAACCFARIAPNRTDEVTLVLAGGYGIATVQAGGWLIVPLEHELSSYWIPRAPVLRRLDSSGHILEERTAPITGLTCSASQIDLKVLVPQGWSLDCVVWRLGPGSQVITELQRFVPLEMQTQFLWGSHTVYRRPADTYLHLVHGHVYENRATWPKHWKIFSENDAHAIHTVLSGLEKATGKKLYGLLKHQLVLSVLDRQGEDGGWRHGEWSDRMEAHFRLHCSAMHMLMDAQVEKPDLAVARALQRAADFLSRQVDRLHAGTWFLHDELEVSVDAMRAAPFRWIASRALGKSPANMLVLNSHLDGTIALHRYGQITGDVRYEPLVDEARAATRAVLTLRPVDWLYRLLFRAIHLTFLPTAKAAQLPSHLRALKRLAWKYLVPLLPWVKAHFPRIVMPGGYIDRELSLRVLAHDYLPINLMDLLRYQRRFAEAAYSDLIQAGFRLIHDYRMFERWPEIGKTYAIGFWAEALYHACLAYPQAEYRSRLVDAILELEARGLGLPPSLLGANLEAVASEEQAATPLTHDARLRVVNLSSKGTFEILFVNCASVAVDMCIRSKLPEDVLWMLGASAEPLAAVPDQVPARGWLWARRQPHGAVAG